MPHITPLHLLGYGDSPESTASPVILGQSPYCCPKQRLLQPMSIGFAMTYTTNDCKDMFHLRTLLPLTLPSPASGEGETLGLSWYCLYQLTLKNCTDERRSEVSSEAYFCSMLSAEAEATTPQMDVFQRQLITPPMLKYPPAQLQAPLPSAPSALSCRFLSWEA